MTERSGDWKEHRTDFPLDNEPAWRGEPFALPLPNATMRASSSVADLDSWYAIGEAWAQIASRFLPPDPTVLDLGCGCGKMARFLYVNPGLRYVGVDIFLPAILWCRENFARLAGDRFRFEHFDGVSEIYNPSGTIRPIDYRLPVDDASIDLSICASLFTHLLEPECCHYLLELYRVAKPGGKALVSIHNEPPPGQRYAGDHARIDIDEGYFNELAGAAGLVATAVVGNVYGQQVLLFERPPEARRDDG